ncbi:MAG: Fur family transcriptional regulator [Bacteroidia bacterium]
MTTKQILTSHGLRHTESREEILDIFLTHNIALSQPEIEKELKSCDRVTIYRTLATFFKKGILHKVLDDEGATKYALCSSACSEHHHHDHVHFKCLKCGNTTCVDETHTPEVHLPEGYLLEEVSMLIQGICAKCSS